MIPENSFRKTHLKVFQYTIELSKIITFLHMLDEIGALTAQFDLGRVEIIALTRVDNRISRSAI